MTDIALSAHQRRALEELLAAHRPLDDTECAHLAAIREFAARHPDPFSRRVAEGHLTGSAFVVAPDGRVLLTHHSKLGIWIQLGGHADAERIAHEVALREATEESGLSDLQFAAALAAPDGTPRLLDVDVHQIPARPGEPAHLHLDLRFLLRTRSPDRIVCDQGESRALEWVTLDEARARCELGMHRALERIEHSRRPPPRFTT